MMISEYGLNKLKSGIPGDKCYAKTWILKAKATVRGVEVVEISAHSIQSCDWRNRQRDVWSTNQGTESSGLKFKLLILLSWFLT